jgi:hypothetical protein
MESAPEEQSKSWLAQAVSKLDEDTMGSKFWLRHGFETFEDYIEHMERSWDDVPWAYEPREVPEVPPPEFSIGSIDSELPARRRSRQVGMRLTPGDYEALAEAAGHHGVAPSTLARILVVAGARALLSRIRSG